MKNVFLLLSLFAQFSIFGQNIQEKKVYAIETARLDSITANVVKIFDNTPFSVSISTPKDSAVKEVVALFNNGNAVHIADLNHVFSFNNIDSITLKIRVASKTFTSTPEQKFNVISYKEADDTIIRRDTLPPLQLQEYITALTERGINTYTVKTIRFTPPNKMLKLGDFREYTVVFLNYIEDDSLQNSDFFVGSLIKSLAGARPVDEFIDLFIKISYGQQKRTFSLFGADAGLGSNRDSSSGTTGLFRINEAMANVNYAVYLRPPHLAAKGARLTLSQKRENLRSFDSLYRTGFIGAGLKIFSSNPYIGVHGGITEINGPLFGSYLMAGYYYSPYLKKVITRDSSNFQTYRHNVYFEAGINAFGSKVPSVLRTMRLKFGMMLPIGYKQKGRGDIIHPESKDVISRLAVEVPIGSVFRF